MFFNALPAARRAELGVYTAGILYLVYVLLLRAEWSDRYIALCEAAPDCARRLAPGWLGRVLDLGDDQWAHVRGALGLLVPIAVVFVGASRAARAGGPALHRAFYLAASAGLLCYLHGAHAAFAAALVAAGYALVALAGALAPAAVPGVVWGYCLTVLFTNEWYSGWYAFGPRLGPAFAWLDEYRGVYPWYRGFNLIILRMISFAMDKHWAANAGGDDEKAKARRARARAGAGIACGRDAACGSPPSDA